VRQTSHTSSPDISEGKGTSKWPKNKGFFF